jgi:hypothetical protein
MKNEASDVTQVLSTANMHPWQARMIKKQIGLYELKKVLAMMLLLSCGTAAVAAPGACQAQTAFSSPEITSASEEKQDPNKPASERNHHLTGYALIAIGILVIASESSDRLRPIGRVWPLLFIAAGLFLALWSDGEIWPRGTLSWTWLVHHDPEARQHKIYAILLIAMGVLEYRRIRGKLSRFSRIWCSPMLALAGIVLLMFHDHTAGSGATSPEAQEYVVSWFAKGKEPPVTSVHTHPNDPAIAMHHHHNSMSNRGPIENEPPARSGAVEPHMEMENKGNVHQHHMTTAMLKVEQQHLWFAFIGLSVVLFKFIHDSAARYRSFTGLLWPSCIAMLGVLLVFYAE